MAMMAATVWFIPGWLRTAEPREGILECVSNAFPEASVEFKNWDGDNVVWPLSVDSADKVMSFLDRINKINRIVGNGWNLDLVNTVNPV